MSWAGAVEKAPETEIVEAEVVKLVIAFTSTLEFLLYCTDTTSPESSSKFIPCSSDIKGFSSLSSKRTAPLEYT